MARPGSIGEDAAPGSSLPSGGAPSDEEPIELTEADLVDEPAPSSSYWWGVGAATLYALLAIAATGELIVRIGTHLPLGTQPAATVPYFNLWTAWWNADRLRHGLQGYWGAPIFHPVEGAFAFSEAQPTLWIVAPFVWAGAPVLAYNLYLLAALWLNGWFGRRLAVRLDLPAPLAVLTGAMLLLLPFVHWQLGVLQLVPLWGIFWTILALDRVAAAPSLRHGALLGAAFGITYLLCNYHGLFLTATLSLSAPCLFGRRLLRGATWVSLLAALAVAAAIMFPVIWAQLNYLLEHRFDRDLAQVQSLSSDWNDFLLPWGRNLLGSNRLISADYEWMLLPGHLKTLLALFGLAAGLWSPALRRWTLFWGTFTTLAVLFASAAKIEVAGFNLYEHLLRECPGFAQIRTLYRFAVLMQIGLVMLAASGLACLWRAAEGRAWARALAWTLALASTFEVWPTAPALQPAPNSAQPAEWTEWLRDRTPQDAVVCGLPFPAGTSEAAHETSGVWMLSQIHHRRPLVNGYSAFFPDSYRSLKADLAGFPGDAAMKALLESGVDYLVVDPGLRREEDPSRLDESQIPLPAVFRDRRQGVTIYRVSPPGEPPASP